jgi:hypothetical protein
MMQESKRAAQGDGYNPSAALYSLRVPALRPVSRYFSTAVGPVYPASSAKRTNSAHGPTSASSLTP